MPGSVERGAMRNRALIIALCLLGTARTAAADSLAYVRASSQYAGDKNPATYHPINLLDDDPTTTWCAGGDGLGEGQEIRFYFKESQRIDRVVITPTPLSGRRVTGVKVSDGTNAINIELNDIIAQQPLKRPMAGTTFVVSISQVSEAQKGSVLPDNVACLADVLLFFKNKPFGGRTNAEKLKYDPHRDKLLGRWNGAPLGASERFLTFALDGSWDWSFIPILGGKNEKMAGEYRFRGNRLLMRRGETGRWADVNIKSHRVVIEPNDIGAPKSDYDVIELNDLMGESFGGEYNNAEF